MMEANAESETAKNSALFFQQNAKASCQGHN